MWSEKVHTVVLWTSFLVMTARVIEDHSRKCWQPRWPASIVFERACRYCSAQLALLTKLPSNLSIGSCRCSPSLTHFPGSTWTGWLDTKKYFFAEKSRIKIRHQDKETPEDGDHEHQLAAPPLAGL